jgi:hypothetical protein
MKISIQYSGKMAMAIVALLAFLMTGQETSYAHFPGRANMSEQSYQYDQEGGGQGFGRRSLQRRPRLGQKTDQNGDGMIDQEERQQALEVLRSRRESRGEQRDEWFENHPNVSEQLDRNDDGTVGRREAKWGKRFNQADRNNDGGINRVEVKRAYRARKNS